MDWINGKRESVAIWVTTDTPLPSKLWRGFREADGRRRGGFLPSTDPRGAWLSTTSCWYIESVLARFSWTVLSQGPVAVEEKLSLWSLHCLAVSPKCRRDSSSCSGSICTWLISAGRCFVSLGGLKKELEVGSSKRPAAEYCDGPDGDCVKGT